MDRNWQELTISAAPLEIIDGDRGANYPTQDEFAPTGHCLFLNTSNVTLRGFDFTACNYITKEKDGMLRKGKLQRNDVVLTTRGTVGNVALFDDSVPFDQVRINSGMVLLRADPTKLLPRFLYQFVRSPHFKSQVASLSTGSAQPQLPIRDIRCVRLPLPPPADQQAIAHILGTLDDKIELNRRTNLTLQATTQAIFRSWFIDFDPTRAKRVGKQLQAPAPAIAALFPEAFQASPIGLVPKGWAVEPFSTHITAERGLSYKGEGLRDDATGLPMHNLNSVYEGGGYKHAGIKYYAGEYREKHLLKAGDLIVTNTEQGFDYLLIGHAAIVPECFGPEGLYSHHLYRVRTKPSSPFTPHYLAQLFNNRRWHYWISGFSNGTTINMLPKDALEMPLLVVPPKPLINKFTTLAAAIHAQVESNLTQSRTLAKLRDTLLPKLLSGEFRVTTRHP